MNKIYIIVFMLLGFFLMSGTSYACGSGSGKHSCKMEMTSKEQKMDCCSKKSNSKNKGCSGKCGQSMCSVSPINIGVTAPIQYEMLKPLFSITEKKQNFSHAISVLSDGYTSLWLIPKIG